MTDSSADGPNHPDDKTRASNAGSSRTSASPDGAGIPKRIARYEIRRVIASGGMGTVFEAIQDQPRRPVAIKVMKHGVVSPASLRRFEFESQLLASLRHPGIAQVYEAGTYDDGSGLVPFFAMEYIPNAKPITEFAREKGLGVRERLEVFAEVCDAVHYAHQRGVIHRDLKPSNILIDSSGRPRIIDFGVARSLDADLVQASMQTEYGQLVGTLHYMSPEQFEADASDLDTRSDVYALGVVLYELMAGFLPYPVDQSAIYEVARIIREQAPSKLSQRNPSLAGEIETIVNKALEKDRERRYQSAHGLAQDIRRYLAGEAISARPPSMSYQISVFARRNKALMGAVAAVFAVLITGIAVSVSLYFKASEEKQRAEIEATRAVAATKFLKEMLSEAMPEGFGESTTLAELFEFASHELDGAFPHDPQAEADIRTALGWSYLNVGNWDGSKEQFQMACQLRAENLGAEDTLTVESLEDLALAHLLEGNSGEYVDVCRRLLDIQIRTLGPDHLDTIDRRGSLAYGLEWDGRLREAEEMALENLEICRASLPSDSEETLDALHQYTWLLFARGKVEEAEKLARESHQLALTNHGEGQKTTRESRSLLAAILISEGKIEQSKELYGNRSAPRDLGVKMAFQGQSPDPTVGTKVLVFWEVWCPFSQRTMPSMEKTYQQYKDKGLEIIGITEVNRSATDEWVRKFVADKHLTYPILKGDGTAWNYLDCQGTPWVYIIQDGVIVWENDINTPEKFPRGVIDKLVSS